MTFFSIPLEPKTNTEAVLREATVKIHAKYDFYETTLQIEMYDEDMEDCRDCDNPWKGWLLHFHERWLVFRLILMPNSIPNLSFLFFLFLSKRKFFSSHENISMVKIMSSNFREFSKFHWFHRIDALRYVRSIICSDYLSIFLMPFRLFNVISLLFWLLNFVHVKMSGRKNFP